MPQTEHRSPARSVVDVGELDLKLFSTVPVVLEGHLLDTLSNDLICDLSSVAPAGRRMGAGRTRPTGGR